MDGCILKDLYENLDSMDKFIILVENNYNPDKKLLYKLLEYLDKKFLISNEEFIVSCDLIKKLLTNKDYDENLTYFNLALKIKNYNIVELLIKHNVKFYIGELMVLINDKNILKLILNNNYCNVINNIHNSTDRSSTDFISLMIKDNEIYKLMLDKGYRDIIKNNYCKHENIQRIKNLSDDLKIIILQEFKDELPEDLISYIITNGRYERLYSEQKWRWNWNIKFAEFIIFNLKPKLTKCNICANVFNIDYTIDLFDYYNFIFNDEEKIKILKLLLNNGLLKNGYCIDNYILSIFREITYFYDKDQEINLYLNKILDLDNNFDLDSNKLQEYQIIAKDKDVEYIYNNIINILNERGNKNYELLKIPKIVFKVKNGYKNYTDNKDIIEFNSFRLFELYFYKKFGSLIRYRRTFIEDGVAIIGVQESEVVGTYNIDIV